MNNSKLQVHHLHFGKVFLFIWTGMTGAIIDFIMN